MRRKCGRCGAPIIPVRTDAGQVIALAPEPNRRGMYAVTGPRTAANYTAAAIYVRDDEPREHVILHGPHVCQTQR